MNYTDYFPAHGNVYNGKKIIYFDAACTYLKNQATLDAINTYYTEYSCCSGDRESSILWAELLEKMQSSRTMIRDFLWAKPEDFIVFTSSTTDGINKIISGIDTDVITTLVTTDIEHNSNYLPQYQQNQKSGIDLITLKLEDIESLENFESHISSIEWAFLLSVTHISNITWKKLPISEIADIVHKYEGYILVDDAQYVTYNQEDVEKNSIDFCVFSAHKLWWPTGIGVLYIHSWSENILKYSSQIGWGTVKTISNFHPQYKGFPYFLEWWVQDFAGILGIGACIEMIHTIGIDSINEYVLSLQSHFLQQFSKYQLENHITIISESESSLVSLIPKNWNTVDFHQYCNYFLEDSIIIFRTGTMCADNYANSYLKTSNIMRFSFWIYNSFAEIDILIDALVSYIETTKQ